MNNKPITPEELYEKILSPLAPYEPDLSHLDRRKELQLALITKAKKEWEKEDLTKFLYWLLKHGYCDDDVYFEPPTAIDRYLILNAPEPD